MRNLIRLSLLASALVGCPRPAHESRDVTLGARSAESSQAQPSASARDTVTVCVLRDGRGRLAQARYDPLSRDTLIEGEPSAQIYPRIPPPYPDSTEWFLRRDPIVVQGRTLVWNGTPIAALPDELKPMGSYRGITLFSEFPEAREQSTVFLPVEPGCEFQPYYYFDNPGPNRNG